MKSGKCPKCDSDDIVIHTMFNRHFTLGFFKGRVLQDMYTCMTCGYFEQYIDKDDLEAIRSYQRSEMQQDMIDHRKQNKPEVKRKNDDK